MRLKSFFLIGVLGLTGSLAMMNDGLRDAFDPSSSSAGKAKKKNSVREPAK